MANKALSRALMAGALLFCVLLITPQSFADSFARIVRLSDIEGSVDVDRGTGQGFEKALLNMPITQGVRLKTGVSGRAEVEFENGSVIRLVGDSDVSFTQLSLRTNGDHVNEIQVEDGVVYIDFRHKGGDEFRVAVANYPFDLTKDVRFRLQVNRGELELAVFKGELNVQGAAQSAKVKKGESFTLDLNDGAKYSLAKGITPLNTDGYEQEREQYVQQYASNQNHGSPYAYGYSDLNRYGSFFDAPGYGLVWQPASMGMGWDPYSNGYWSFYPGSGYVWISSYPWGWTPYRYGQWMFLSGSGWVWRPGGWNQWNRGVVVYNPPPTWRGPTPPTQGSGPTVPVGKPIPPHRTLNTEDMNPHRPDRLNPVAPNGEVSGGTAQTGAPTKSMNPSRPAPPTANVTQPMAPTTIQTQPAQPTRANEPARMNKGVREYNMEADRPHRAQSAPAAAPSPSAPSKSMAQPAPAAAPSMQPSRPSPPPSAPPPTMQPSRPTPAPRVSPSKSSSNNFQAASGGGVHSGASHGTSHPAHIAH